jgi:hypothetical protein
MLTFFPTGSVLPNADPYPAFYLGADPDEVSHTKADPDPGQTLKCKIFVKLAIGKKNLLSKVQKPVFLFFINCCQFSCSWIRIQLLNADPDPQHCLRADFKIFFFELFSFLSGSVPGTPSSADTDGHQALNHGHFCNLVVV